VRGQGPLNREDDDNGEDTTQSITNTSSYHILVGRTAGAVNNKVHNQPEESCPIAADPPPYPEIVTAATDSDVDGLGHAEIPDWYKVTGW
jgi:hypothetical protein